MRKIYQFDGPVRMVEGRYGHMLYSPYDQWVGSSLENYGEYCEIEIDAFKAIVKPTDVIWEIGANMGSQAVPLAKMVPEGKYVGFEPQVELFKILAANLALNGLVNARPINCALGNENGTIALPPVDYEMPSNFGGLTLIETPPGDTIVEQRRIDDLPHLPAPNFLKIDVEGMELSVLRGGAETIKKMRPIIYVENDKVESSRELIETLWGMNYNCYWHIIPYYNPKNFFGVRTNLYTNSYSINMICVSRASGLNVQGIGAPIKDSSYHPIIEREMKRQAAVMPSQGERTLSPSGS